MLCALNHIGIRSWSFCHTEGCYQLRSLAFKPVIHHGAYGVIVIPWQNSASSPRFRLSRRAPPLVPNRVRLGPDVFQNCAILISSPILDNLLFDVFNGAVMG